MVSLSTAFFTCVSHLCGTTKQFYRIRVIYLTEQHKFLHEGEYSKEETLDKRKEKRKWRERARKRRRRSARAKEREKNSRQSEPVHYTNSCLVSFHACMHDQCLLGRFSLTRYHKVISTVFSIHYPSSTLKKSIQSFEWLLCSEIVLIDFHFSQHIDCCRLELFIEGKIFASRITAHTETRQNKTGENSRRKCHYWLEYIDKRMDFWWKLAKNFSAEKQLIFDERWKVQSWIYSWRKIPGR